MQFNLNYSPQENRVKTITNFRGVDYSISDIDVADNRALDMQNFIFKDGLNQKRNGYIEKIKLENGRINGYWEFIDSKKVIHRIAHAGDKLYEINYGDTLFGNSKKQLNISYIPEIHSAISGDYYMQDWANYVAQIKDEKSFGIVRGDRLYIFCGIMCVYGSWDDGQTWELRAVRDNSDTYIPITTTNITHMHYEGKSTRASLEEVNMMSTLRKNKMYGASYKNNDYLKLENYDPGDNWGSDFADKYNKGYRFNGIIDREIAYLNFFVFDETDESKYEINIPLIADGVVHNEMYSYDSSIDETSFQVDGNFIEKVPAFSMRYTYKKLENGTYELYIPYIKFGLETETAVLEEGIHNYWFSYQLDSTNISNTPQPKLYIDDELIVSSWTEEGKAIINTQTENKIQLNYIDGILKLCISTENEDNPNPNMELLFTTESILSNKMYEKIDKCSVGAIFGYNGIEHLFVSGNEDYPNMDWHTTESLLANENSTIPNSQNLTYFGDLSYAYLGNTQTKVKSYLILNDNTLGILKEFNPNEPSLFVREPYMTDALDPSGNVVVDLFGNTYKKLYYKQYMASIGEGCISSYASSNLAGDKVFLSRNGLYGIELDYNNYASNQRYAKERSRRINPVLEAYDISVLQNASSIVFENRYYLSLNDENGTVFIADARFRNGGDEEMNDTLGYEWYVWKNVPARIWYIDYNGKLCFGTDDGRLCSFSNKNNYADIKVLNGCDGNIAYNHTINKFVANSDLNIKNGSTIYFNTSLEELIGGEGEFSTVSNFSATISDVYKFYNYICFLEDKEVNVYTSSNASKMKGIIKNLDYENKTFEVYVDDSPFQLTEYSIITRDLKIETVNEYNEDYFDLISFNGTNVMQIYGDSNNDIDCYVESATPVKAVWYTPFMNMGTPEYSKTIRYLTVVPKNIEHGNATMKILTKGNSKDIIVEGTDNLSLMENLDFNTFSLEIKDFAKSFTKKLKIRNFNFLMYCLTSDNDKNFAVQSIVTNYIISKRNRGVK